MVLILTRPKIWLVLTELAVFGSELGELPNSLTEIPSHYGLPI